MKVKISFWNGFFALFLLITTPLTVVEAEVISRWIPDGSDYSYFVTYTTTTGVDIGDPWKTVESWSTCGLPSGLDVDISRSYSHDVTFEAGWDQLIKAGFSISSKVDVTKKVNFHIDGCVKEATMKWRWLGDSVSGAWGYYYVGDGSKTYLWGDNIDKGYYNYSVQYSGLQTKGTCTDPPCPEPSTTMFVGLGIIGIGYAKRRQARSVV